MDGRAVEAAVAVIKAQMPTTYASIKAKAAELGPGAFAMVRRSLKGAPNQFWAMERGHVMGTPFSADHPIQADVALALVQFGPVAVVIWGEPDGAH